MGSDRRTADRRSAKSRATNNSGMQSEVEPIYNSDAPNNDLESTSPIDDTQEAAIDSINDDTVFSTSNVEKQQGANVKKQQQAKQQMTKKQPPAGGKAAGEAQSQEKGLDGMDGKKGQAPGADAQGENADSDEMDPRLLPTKNNPLYNTSEALRKLEKYPELKIRQEGKYYLKINDVVVERHQKPKRNKRGDIVPVIKKEPIGPIENIVSRFCEDVMCISRANFLPLTTQGERHLIWVGKRKATHIINRLNGNGCYVINRFPGDIFLKDKQVMGVTLAKHMLARSNTCVEGCGFSTEKSTKPGEDPLEPDATITNKICMHMISNMKLNKEGCDQKTCPNFERKVCEHLDVFIPEIQSFCTYNALQEFSNRLEGDLKDQTFVCKPAYLYKGYGFRFFQTPQEFQEFYHMTEGKETSRHDFMVQRLVDNPHLFLERKYDIRAFLLVVVLRHRRVISFVHHGFCRLAHTRYDEINEAENKSTSNAENVQERNDSQEALDEHNAKMRAYICTFVPPAEKLKRQKMMEQGKFFDKDSDRSLELDGIYETKGIFNNIKRQINNIGKRISEAIENKVWESFGCFQIFSMDLCVDENYKVWLIEVNSHAISEVDTLSPTQRKVVPAVIMEALGLVMETTYKSYKNMRLRKSPTDEFENTGFLFRQNFQFVFSTLAKKRKDYVWPKPAAKKDLPYYERIAVVDKQMKRVEKRKAECEATKRKVHQEAMELKKKRSEKNEEES